MAASLIGQTLGKYQITQLVGHGGMATVYQGYQADVNRYVAIKVLPPHPGRDAQFTERFRREAQTIARLQHPHILPLYDFGVQDDILYLVMAYVQGGSLSDAIRRGPMLVSDVERLLNQIAPALDYAHRQGVIHRDIKPDNILLDTEGHALLADFGIAKLVQDEGAATITGSLIGTPAYMSPEQGQGLPVETRSDIYSLGIVVYEMLTGRQPFIADTPLQVVLQHVTAPLPSLTSQAPHLPGALDRVMERALAKAPENRYASAAAFAADFSRAAHGQEIEAGARSGDTGDESATLIFGQPATTTPAPTAANNPTGSTTAPAIPQLQTTQVAPVASPHVSLILVVGAVVIIGLLVLAIVVLALRDNRPPVSETSIVQQATSAPTQVVTSVAVARPRLGSVRFSTSEQQGDTVTLDLEALSVPPAGEHYAAWLTSSTGGEVLPLGMAQVDGLGSGVLQYVDAEGRTLPALFDTLLVTRETGAREEPEGDVVYHARISAEVPRALREILVGSERGINGGSLLAGLQSEANIGRQHAGLAAGATNTGGMHTHAEHTINVFMGTTEDYNGDGRGQNPGHGEGVAYFLEAIETELNNAANAPSASPALQSQVELIRACVVNTRQRMEQIVILEGEMIASDDVQAMEPNARQSTELAEQLIAGNDLNGNGQVEPFEGECGIEQIATFGVLVANMELVEGAPVD